MAVANKAATCTEAGFSRYTCTRGCGELNDVAIPATGHTRVETNIPGTCTEPGVRSAACAVCDANLPVFGNNPPALGHAWDCGVYTEPSRDADGFTTYNCTRDDCCATDVVTDEGSQWVVTGATATAVNVTGNTYRITVTETYSGGPNEVYWAEYAFNTIPNNNPTGQTFVVGPYSVTITRSGNVYTVISVA
jgi:hypothetical protein